MVVMIYYVFRNRDSLTSLGPRIYLVWVSQCEVDPTNVEVKGADGDVGQCARGQARKSVGS